MRAVYTKASLEKYYAEPSLVINCIDGELQEGKHYIVADYIRIDSSKISVVVEELDFGGEKG